MPFKKKGVSPLIATVLLLAFAVALATVVIQLEPFGKCKLTNVQISKLSNGQPRICFNEKTKTVEFFVTNGDKKAIIGFKIRASGIRDTLNIGNIPITLGQNEEKKVTFNYDVDTYGKIVELKIIPLINVSNRPMDCEIKGEITSIPLCS